MLSSEEPTPPNHIPIEPIICPFTVIIDTREQAPFFFTGFVADAKHRQPLRDPSTKKILKDSTGKPYTETPELYIPTTRAGLPTGDYSIEGFTDQIAIERKSLDDLFRTLSSGRDRFERELERLSRLKVAHVVIESDWTTIIKYPPDRSKLSPKSVFRSINAWQQQFPTIHWDLMGGRGLAEHKTLRILERFWVNLEREKAAESEQKELETVPSDSDKHVTTM